MEQQTDVYFSVFIPEPAPGMRYKFHLESGEFPNPASRFQPIGPHGPSEIVDPDEFPWTDRKWKGVSRVGEVIYEMHVANFTPEGNWQTAAAQLEALAILGIDIIELHINSDIP